MEILTFLCMIPVALLLVLVGVFIWNRPIILIYFQIVFACTMRFIYSELPVPSSIRYMTDVVAVLLFVQTFLHGRKVINRLNIKIPLVCMALFIVSTVISFLLSGQDILSYAWGGRILFRFFVFFLACAVFLHRDDVKNIIRILFWLLPVNVLASSFQYFVQGYTFDFNGGLFGMEIGCNAEMNMYLVLLVIFAFAMYLKNQFKLSHLVMVLIMSLYIAALSELKVLFFEIPIIFLLVALLYKPTKRTFGILFVGGIAVYFAVALFLVLYPDWANFFTVDTIMKYLTSSGYAGGDTLNRFSAIQYVLKNLLTDVRMQLFGVGLGNGDISSFFVSDFYEKYQHLKYTFFGFAHTLVENGLVGLLCYISVFVGSAIHCFVMMHKKQINVAYAAVGCVVSVFALFFGIYNQALRTEVSYVYFFWLAVPFVMYKERNVKDEDGATSVENL